MKGRIIEGERILKNKKAIECRCVASICTLVIGLYVIMSLSCATVQESPTPLKNSMISVSPIFIDDSDPNHNWASFIAAHPWSSGSGTHASPYIIRDISINAQGTLNCIRIQNSDKVFHIENCVFFNTDPFDISAGIKCTNVTSGFIMGSEIFINGFFGVELVKSNVVVKFNFIHDNSASGIYLGACSSSLIHNNAIEYHGGSGITAYKSDNIGIINNDISYSGYSGVSLRYSNNSEISDNTIFNNFDGIFLSESIQNIIEENNVFNNEECGMHLEYYSNDNRITYNTFHDNLYCILIGKSCVGTYLSNNGECKIYTFDDTPEPPPPPPPPPPPADDDSPHEISGYLGIVSVMISTVFILSIAIATRKKDKRI